MTAIYNPFIIIPFATWIVAQLAKFFVATIRNPNRFDLRYLYASGGMPSAHSAVVCSLAVTSLIREGIDSPIFGLSAVFAAIVMYDSFGVRRAAGEQAAAINSIFDSMSRGRLGLGQSPQRLREILGHKPLEVTVGAIVGTILALVFNANYLDHQITWLSTLPGRTEVYIFAAASLVYIIAGRIFSVIIRRRYQNSKVIKSLTRQTSIMSISVGLVGLILAFASYQKALYLGWRLWMYVLLALVIIWKLSLIGIFGPRLPAALTAESEHHRIRSWLPGKKTKRRRG